jgi:hypothetical protein
MSVNKSNGIEFFPGLPGDPINRPGPADNNPGAASGGISWAGKVTTSEGFGAQASTAKLRIFTEPGFRLGGADVSIQHDQKRITIQLKTVADAGSKTVQGEWIEVPLVQEKPWTLPRAGIGYVLEVYDGAGKLLVRPGALFEPVGNPV